MPDVYLEYLIWDVIWAWKVPPRISYKGGVTKERFSLYFYVSSKVLSTSFSVTI